ncbi:hypothetical protein D3C84_1174900 [compost metagenome]
MLKDSIPCKFPVPAPASGSKYLALFTKKNKFLPTNEKSILVKPVLLNTRFGNEYPKTSSLNLMFVAS